VHAVVACSLVLLCGCGGGGGPKTDADAVAQVLKDTVAAAADGDGDKACSHLTPDAQRQAILQTGAGRLGNVDCATAVKQAQLVLTPLDKSRIKSLQPTNVVVNGGSASATLASESGAAPGQGISIQLNLQKLGEDWKISGFQGGQGVPGF
jgi:hypothetical protein